MDFDRLAKILSRAEERDQLLASAERAPPLLTKPRIYMVECPPPDHDGVIRVRITVERGRIGKAPLRYTVVVRAWDESTWLRTRKILAAIKRKLIPLPRPAVVPVRAS